MKPDTEKLLPDTIRDVAASNERRPAVSGLNAALEQWASFIQRGLFAFLHDQLLGWFTGNLQIGFNCWRVSIIRRKKVAAENHFRSQVSAALDRRKMGRFVQSGKGA
jgi:hypothetical protein